MLCLGSSAVNDPFPSVFCAPLVICMKPSSDGLGLLPRMNRAKLPQQLSNSATGLILLLEETTLKFCPLFVKGADS